jgi:iron complex transport system substrate-binding protein
MGAALAGLALVSLAAAACGDDDDDATPTKAVTTSQATAAASPSAEAVSYPLKVTDMAGRSVEIKQKPTKIVAVSPTAVEMVYAAGGTVLGRSSTAKFPAEAQTAADIGSAYKPAIDKILELKPDLIVGDSVIIEGMPAVRTQIESAGVPAIFVGAESYQDVLTGLDLMGKVLGNTAKTDAAKASIAKARDDAKAALAGKNISIIALTADEQQQLYAAKENSYVGDIFKQVGLTNPAKDLPDTPPIPGYSLVAPEKLLQLNPDYIFAITPDPRAPALGPTIAKIPPFAGLKAVTGNHVIDANLDLFLQAPGPRIGDAFKALTAALTGQPAAGSSPAAASPSATR